MIEVQQMYGVTMFISKEVSEDALFDVKRYAAEALREAIEHETVGMRPVPETFRIESVPFRNEWIEPMSIWQRFLKGLGLFEPRHHVIEGIQLRASMRVWVRR